MRSALVLVLFGIASLLAGCSGIKSYELVLRGSPNLNLTRDNVPNQVLVKVLRLRGEAAAEAFRSAPFDDLWDQPDKVVGVVLQGNPESVYVPARNEPVVVKINEVPPEVTHIGLLAQFHQPEANKERLVMPRDQIDDAAIWLVGSVLGAPAPDSAKAAGADQTAKKDNRD